MHPLVQQYLDVKRGRSTEPELVAIEGRWALDHARRHGVPVEAVLTTADVGAKAMARMTERDGPDDVVALVRVARRTLDDVQPRRRLLVVDAIERPGNLGTLIRAADGAGADAVLVVDRRVRATHPLVVKASMATSLSMPIVDVGRDEAVAWLVDNGVDTVAADPAATSSYRDVDYGPPAAVVVGNERRGLHPSWRTAPATLAAIPMLGVADSLNVTLAAALLIYEAVHRQRALP